MQELSIYIHFPYCELKCPYCDFNSHVVGDLKEKLHLNAYKQEIDFFLLQINQKHKVRSIFFGGGTPSLMQPETVGEILEYIKKQELLLWENPEITLEANPSSSEYTKFKAFKMAGVNRLSLGVQSFNEKNLKFLGRKHNAKEAINALEIVYDLFDEFSFDLIYCLPNQTLTEWEKELQMALQKYAKNHISAYTLTIEKGTPFFKKHQNQEFTLPKNEDEFYSLTNNILEENGFERYEVSNYSKNGKECKHNTAYWQSVDYMGIGAGAHGRITVKGQRFVTQNFAMPEKYLNSMNKMQVFTALTWQEIVAETLLMNLRYKNGINLEGFKSKYGFNIMEFINKKHLKPMQESGLIELNNEVLKLTTQGMNLANAIILKLSP